MAKSEFGRGYAVCLRQFLWHEPRLSEYVEDYAKLRDEHPTLFSPERAVEMWCDGAVDHLYDLARPRRWVTREDWQQAKTLRTVMIDGKWGGRFANDGVPLDEAAVRDWLATAKTLLARYARHGGVETPETFEDAWALDEAAGLKPARGDAATCEGPIPSRRRLPA